MKNLASRAVLTAPAALAALLMLAACSGSPAATAAAKAAPIPRGPQICRDINNWIPMADSDPVFDWELSKDEAVASKISLGADLLKFQEDLESNAFLALAPGPPGQPGDTQILSKDCRAYGVALDWRR